MKLNSLMSKNTHLDIKNTQIYGLLATVQAFQIQKLQLLFSRKLRPLFSNFFIIFRNLTEVLKNPNAVELPGRYDGYASCPLFVGKNKLILAEFKYDGVIDETFFNHQ